MVIDWAKVSEIIFGALLTGIITGIISGVTVYIAYLLGKRQSDNEWKRELEQRKKETLSELNLKRIEKVSDYLKVYASIFSMMTIQHDFEVLQEFKSQFMADSEGLIHLLPETAIEVRTAIRNIEMIVIKLPNVVTDQSNEKINQALGQNQEVIKRYLSDISNGFSS